MNFITIGNKFEMISSHFCYDTKNISVIKRISYDDNYYVEQFDEAIRNYDYQAIVYSGKEPHKVARYLDQYVDSLCNINIAKKYRYALKAVRLQNTNLSEKYTTKCSRDSILSSSNAYVKVALSYPFDILFVQTYGDAEIFNAILGRNSAYYFPFAFNENVFFPRKSSKIVDIGMYCAVERHAYRLDFIKHILELSMKNGWKFEFSNAYWGTEYACALNRAKINLHLSKMGDVPYRLYECAGSKLCLLTDPLLFGVEHLYTPGEHFVQYKRDCSDIEEKIKWLLENPNEREFIAEAAYNQATSHHTWNVIAETYVVPIVSDLLRQRTR